MSWCCLTSGDERSAIKIEGYARNDDAREALSKLRGACLFYAPHHHFAFLISNFSFKRSFRTQSKDGMPKGLTLNLLFFVAFPHTYMLKLDIIQNYQSMG